jgi:uncharacterized membrane protein YfcA
MEVVLMMAEGIKIHEIKRHTFISFFIAVICLIIGLQYIGTVETRETGVLAVVFGVLLAIAAIYMFFKPMIVLGDDTIYFQSQGRNRCREKEKYHYNQLLQFR